MSEELFHRRCFLNDESGAAIIEASFSDNSWVDRQTSERRLHYDGTIHITDCSRSIELSLNIDNDAESARNSLRKLDRLLDVIQGVRDAVVRAAKREFPGRKF